MKIIKTIGLLKTLGALAGVKKDILELQDHQKIRLVSVEFKINQYTLLFDKVLIY